MKIHAVAWLLLLSASSVQGQNRSQQRPAEQQTSQLQSAPGASSRAASSGLPNIDPAKEADIRRLMDIAGTKALALQSMTSTEQNIKPLMVSSFPPGEYRDKLIEFFFVKFHSKVDAQQIVDLAVPIYDKYLSDEEIKGLIQFYQTPLGQKTLRVLPELFGELREEGNKWGQKIGRDSMREVLSEHPELVKALEAAKNAEQPH